MLGKAGCMLPFVNNGRNTFTVFSPFTVQLILIIALHVTNMQVKICKWKRHVSIVKETELYCNILTFNWVSKTTFLYTFLWLVAIIILSHIVAAVKFKVSVECIHFSSRLNRKTAVKQLLVWGEHKFYLGWGKLRR